MNNSTNLNTNGITSALTTFDTVPPAPVALKDSLQEVREEIYSGWSHNLKN
jgi:hypothetical protein